MFHILLQSSVSDTLNQVANAGFQNTTPTTETSSPIAMVLKGGWVMIPLFIFLIIAIYFAVERLVVISKAGKLDRNFMANIRDYLMTGKIDSAREMCRSVNTPVSRVIEKGISRLGKPTREVKDAMETAGRAEITRAEKHLHFLSLIAKIAPMLGFIGTVIGVITIFRDISLSGDISIKNVTNGLYVKMFATGIGLAVGVISFTFYHLLNAMLDGLAKKIETASGEFEDIINEPGK
jgi:biopolymer transport protein ExbB